MTEQGEQVTYQVVVGLVLRGSTLDGSLSSTGKSLAGTDLGVGISWLLSCGDTCYSFYLWQQWVVVDHHDLAAAAVWFGGWMSASAGSMKS